ncbi:MAG: AAA family ATPase [Bacilli bacterium]|nr:AAA family ATPase [Bacilli bacterium]
MQSNPFSMTFGIEPNNYIKRIKESELIISEFTALNPSNYVYIITGIRGSGKTVLLSNIANHFMNNDDFLVVDPGPKNNILENIASEIYETGKVKKLFLKKDFSFSFHGLSFSISGDEPVSSINTIIKKMLDYLKKKKKRVLITIDEVDNSAEMKTFIEAYQTLIRLKYPVFLLMTGLYENINKLQDDKSLTFLYRAPKINIEPLNIKSIEIAYKKYLNIDSVVANKMANLTKGYAYAYQVLGYLAFTSKKKDIDEELINDYDQYLAAYVYDKIYSELSNKEKELLNCFEHNQEISLKELAIKMNEDSKYISVYRDRLIKKGVLMSKTYGMIEFALPRFYDFLKSINY